MDDEQSEGDEQKGRSPPWSEGDLSPGKVHLYTGNGKGKTTAALGLMIRALGQGMECILVQFMKGEFPYGEIKALRGLEGFTVRQFGTLEFVRRGKEAEIDREEARKALEESGRALGSGAYQLVVMDEVCVAVHMDLIPVEDVVKAIEARHQGTEVVMTGRRAHDELRAIADYITEFRNVRHPFDGGCEARKGIEF